MVVDHYIKYGKKYYEANKEKEAERGKTYYAANKDHVVARTISTNRFRRYGLTNEQLEEMTKQQQGLCAICKSPPKEGRRLDVDHNHITKEVRGLLCNNCNRGIGHLQENPEILSKAIAYLTGTGICGS